MDSGIGHLKLLSVSTPDQLADISTKALSPALHAACLSVDPGSSSAARPGLLVAVSAWAESLTFQVRTRAAPGPLHRAPLAAPPGAPGGSMRAS